MQMKIRKNASVKALAAIFGSSLALFASITAADEPRMLINAGLNGSWYEPATSGQGFVFDVVPSHNLMAAYWFTYPVEGGAREWYLARGGISGDSVTLKILQTSNGFFDLASAVERNVVGSAKLQFSSCTQASLEYQIDTLGISNQIPLQRTAPDYLCEKLRSSASTTVVSHSKSWVDIRGDWLFQGCVNLENSDSHGDEFFSFTDTTAILEIDRYSRPDCQGAMSRQVLTLTVQRIDKTMAYLGGETVIANRFILTDVDSGQEIKQLIYVDDRGEVPLLTHGLQDSFPDDEGFPTELPELFFERLE